MTPGDLILSAGTVSTTSFEERVAAAAESGCAGVGLRWTDYASALEAAGSDAELRRILDGHGVEVAEYEVLRHWA